MSVVSYVRIVVETVEPFSIADPADSSAVDRPVAVDTGGKIVVPATGLIGSLRNHFATSTSAQASASVFGSALATADADLVPSALRALGTEVTDKTGAPVTAAAVRRRSQTAIDRHTGAAASRTLRTVEEVSTRCRVTLFCEHDGALPASFIPTVLSWKPLIGGNVGTGHGRAEIVEVNEGAIDLDIEADLATYLTGANPGTFEQLAPTKHTPAPVDDVPALIDLRGEIVDGLFSYGGIETVTVDGDQTSNIATALTDPATGQPVLEGSSLRGVLSARVSYIAASVLAANGADTDTAIAGGAAVADHIFGTTTRRGVVAVETAVIDTGGHPGEARMHVAIDRFTGGAMRGLLFGERVITHGTFTLKVRPLAVAPDAVEVVTALLRGACADINDGLVGLGAMTGRGYGTVTFCQPDQTPYPELADALPLPPTVITQLQQIADQTAHRAPEDKSEPAVPPKPDTKPVPVRTYADDTAGVPEAEPARLAAGELTEIGKLTWTQCRTLAVDNKLSVMWSGLMGTHSGPATELPEQPSTGTHLWGWSDNLWLRARIDGNNCYVSTLQPPKSNADDGPVGAGGGGAVSAVRVERAVPWAPNEARLSTTTRAMVQRLAIGDQWTLTVGATAPISFVHIGQLRFGE